MSKLRSVVSQHAAGLAVAGGPAPTPKPPVDRTKLTKQVTEVGASTRTTFNICLGMYVVLFVAAIVFVVINRDDPVRITAAFAASGITLTGITTAMVSLWAKKARTDLVIAIVTGLDGEALTGALNTVLEKL